MKKYKIGRKKTFFLKNNDLFYFIVNDKKHGFYNYISRFNKERGFYNMGNKYGHWINDHIVLILKFKYYL